MIARRLLVTVVIAWAVLVTGLSFWSVRRDPPTVAEQRDLAAALPEVDRAFGALVAAAPGPDRGFEIGELRLTDCELTPVRDGHEITRDLLVYVRSGGALAVLESIAAGLPAAYAAETGTASGGTRIGMHADAGEFIGIDVAVTAVAGIVPVTVSTGCRPGAVPGSASPEVSRAKDPGPPPVWAESLRSIGANPTSAPTAVHTVVCPGGTTAATYLIDGLEPSVDLAPPLADPEILRSTATGRTFLTNGETVVIDKPAGADLRIGVTRACS